MDQSHYVAIIIVVIVIAVILITKYCTTKKEAFNPRANVCDVNIDDVSDGTSVCGNSGLTPDDVASGRCLKNPFCGPYVSSGTYAPAIGEYPIDVPISKSISDHEVLE